MTESLPFGTTPLPTSSSGSPVHVFLDLDTIASSSQQPQQPQTMQIASFEASPVISQGLDVNSHFLLYAVKNGLIRVLHRTAPLRELLRGHKNQTLQDIRFFQDGDILGTVGTTPSSSSSASSSVLIWRIFERSPAIQADILLEIRAPYEITSIVWHPFDPNQFWMLHQNTSNNKRIGTLVETTRIKTKVEKHAVCEFFTPTLIMEGAVQVSYRDQDLVDLCWSDRETKHILTAFTHTIVLWDLKQLVPCGSSNTNAPTMLSVVSCDPATEPPLSRCFFLPHENAASTSIAAQSGSSGETWTSCFVTGSDQNSRLTLWSAFGPSCTTTPTATTTPTTTPTKIQVLTLESTATSTGKPKPSPTNSKFLVECCFGPAPADASPPSCFLVVADCLHPRLLAVHCQATWNHTSTTTDRSNNNNGNNNDETTEKKQPLLVGCDYVVPFTTQDPTYSMKCMTVPTTDLSEEELNEQGGLIFDMKVFAYQTRNTQCLTLTSYMCLPPESTYVDPTPGVRFQRLWDVHSTHVSDVGGDELSQELELQYDEEYDVEDDDDEPAVTKDMMDAPEPSALPPPRGFVLQENATAATTAPNSQSSLASNPFANWLGAIAAKSSGTTIPPAAAPAPAPAPLPPLPPPGLGLVVMQQPQPLTVASVPPTLPPQPSLSSEQVTPPPPPITQAFLSPMDILGINPTVTAATSSSTTTPSITPTINNRKTAPVPSSSQQQQQPFTILSRQQAPPLGKSDGSPSMAASAPPQPVASGSRSMENTSLADGVVSSSDVIRAVVREELQTLVIPQLQESLQASLASSLQPLQASLDTLQIEISTNNQSNSDVAKEGASALNPEAIADAVDAPLRAAVASQVRGVWIPALESLTNQVLSQVSTRLEQATIDMNANNANKNKNNHKELEAISTQLTTMTALVTQLTNEVQSLRATVAAQQQQATAGTAASASAAATAAAARKSPTAAAPLNVAEATRKEILALLREKRYEAAFTKAVSASTDDMALFCCFNANIQEVLGGNTATLSQPILLCLMQQLSTVLSGPKSNIQLELEWLQEISLSLNASDAQILVHVPPVLQQLVAGINHRMAQGDPALRRSLQRLLQVVRGMQMG